MTHGQGREKAGNCENSHKLFIRALKKAKVRVFCQTSKSVSGLVCCTPNVPALKKDFI